MAMRRAILAGLLLVIVAASCSSDNKPTQAAVDTACDRFENPGFAVDAMASRVGRAASLAKAHHLGQPFDSMMPSSWVAVCGTGTAVYDVPLDGQQSIR